jgi:Txe/YoeB family toxin of Txe-Axe toxin-antitoxin module
MIYLFLLSVVTVILLLLRAESNNGISSVKTEKETRHSNERYSYREEYDYHKSANKEQKLEKIINLMIKDFNNSPYKDKFNVSQYRGSWLFIYKFNNGYNLTISDHYILLEKSNGQVLNSFVINDMQSYQLMKKINELIDRSVNRNQRTYNNEYRQEPPKPKVEPKPETTGNLKLDKILEKIKLRKEQLAKMKSNDPERTALVNELKTYENVANKMKSKAK